MFAISMLVNVKSLGAHFGYFALPDLTVFFDPVHRPTLVGWIVLGALAPIESSLWYRTGERLLAGLPDPRWVALEYGLQAVMLLCLVSLAVSAPRILRRSPPANSPVGP